MYGIGDTYRSTPEKISTVEVAEVLGSFLGLFEENVFGVLITGHGG